MPLFNPSDESWRFPLAGKPPGEKKPKKKPLGKKASKNPSPDEQQKD